MKSKGARSEGRLSPFWRVAIPLFALLAAAMYFPVFLGQVPFPADIVLSFPAWWDHTLSAPPRPHADIGDLVAAFYPFRTITARAFAEGTIPLWNPHILLGSPFQASAQSGLFYPLNLIYAILPLATAWSVGFLIRMFLAACFTALLARSLGVSQAGSIAAGIVFSCCGFLTGWQGQAMIDAVIWLPLMFYCVLRLQRREPRTEVLALAAIVFALPVLAGHPETAFHLGLLTSAFAVFVWAFPDDPAAGRFPLGFAVCFAAAGALAVGLSAIQVLPTLEWIGRIVRDLSVPWPALPIASAVGLVSRDSVASPNAQSIYIPEAISYSGMATLLLTPLAFLHGRKKYVLFFSALTVVSIAGAFGIEPVAWIASHVPVLKAAKNGRLIMSMSLGLAILAGFGIAAIEGHLEKFDSPRRNRGLLVTAGAVATVGLLLYLLREWTVAATDPTRTPTASAAFLAAGLLPIVAALFGRLRRRTFVFTITGILAADLGLFGFGYTDFVARRDIFPETSLTRFLSSLGNPAAYRLAILGDCCGHNFLMTRNVHAADGYEILLDPIYKYFAGYSQNRQEAVMFSGDSILNAHDRRLDLANVRYLAMLKSDPSVSGFEERAERFAPVHETEWIRVYENKWALPRAFAVPLSGIEVIPDRLAALIRLKSRTFQPDQKVVLETDVAGRETNPDTTFNSAVDIEYAEFNEVRVRARVSAPSILVISQTAYPGWTATVNGVPAPVLTANYALTGVPLQTGSHKIELRFRPPLFRIGLAITVASLLIVILMALSGRARLSRAL